MLRVAFVVRSLGAGGTERQLLALMRTLDRRAVEPAVFSFYPGVALQEDCDGNTRIVCVGKSGRWDLFGFCRRLLSALRAFRPDVIHGLLPVPNIVCAMLKPVLPRARIVWGLRAAAVEIENYDIMFRSAYRLEPKLSRLADLIISNSHSARARAIERGYPDSRVVVIPNGIDGERFRPNPGEGARLRERWKIRDREIVFGIAARIDPMKGHHSFMHAAALMAARRPGRCRFVCVGDGPDYWKRPLLEEAARLELGDRLVWLKNCSEMAAAYSAFDVYTSASSFGEGFSNSIGEAMACQVPCVVTDVGDSARIVGETGIVVKPRDPDAIVYGWELMLDRGREGLRASGAAARERALSEFSLKLLAERTTAALEAIV